MGADRAQSLAGTLEDLGARRSLDAAAETFRRLAEEVEAVAHYLASGDWKAASETKV